MADYVGQNVVIKTESGIVKGKLTCFSHDSGKLTVEDSYNISNEIDLADIVEVSLMEAEGGSDRALTEDEMYQLFYDAFNVYGPFEDNFCTMISMALKKFLRNPTADRVKIIIGSDDIFGRIGLCFARLLIGKTALLEVDLETEISDLRTMKYKNAYENSGGKFNNLDFGKENAFDNNSNVTEYRLILFATNRNFDFNLKGASAVHSIILDIPTSVSFSFTGIGLGFRPENYKICPGFFYLADVGFSKILCEKYRINKTYKANLVKIEISK